MSLGYPPKIAGVQLHMGSFDKQFIPMLMIMWTGQYAVLIERSAW